MTRLTKNQPKNHENQPRQSEKLTQEIKKVNSDDREDMKIHDNLHTRHFASEPCRRLLRAHARACMQAPSSSSSLGAYITLRQTPFKKEDVNDVKTFFRIFFFQKNYKLQVCVWRLPRKACKLERQKTIRQ